MQEYIEPLNRLYKDQHGIIVNVTGYDRANQRVIYNRPGYEHDCASPLIVFRAKFRRVEG